MGPLKTVITSVVATVSAAVLLATFQEPIVDYVRGTHLLATVEAGPWYPLPYQSGADPAKGLEKTGISSYTVETLTSGQDLPFARVTVLNRGRETISGIRFRFPEKYQRPLVLFPEAEDQKFSFAKEPREVQLDDMLPGEERTFYLWRNLGFDYPNYLRDMQSFSSDGPARVKLLLPEDAGALAQADGTIERFFGIWGGLIVVSVLLLFVLILAFVVHLNEKFWKRLLSDETFYLDERIKYEADPARYYIGRSKHETMP